MLKSSEGIHPVPVGRAKDETGNRYGNLKVLYRVDVPDDVATGQACWLCACDCGRYTIALGNNLRRGISESCGCGRTDNPGTKLPKGQAAYNALLHQYIREAEERGIWWGLDTEEFDEITQRHCFYCGAPPMHAYYADKNGAYYANGIDRLDPNGNYTPTNAVACCPRCNKAKMDMMVGEFLGMCKEIYEEHFA